MSRHASLPPRGPFQKKTTAHLIHEPLQSSSCKELNPHHQKSISQSSILVEQPEWVDDLLCDSETYTKGMLHRRSASDSMTLLDGLVSLNDDDSSVSSETGSGLESGCVYGPNSPRRKGKFTFPDNTMVSALSNSLSQNPMEYFDGDFHASGLLHCDLVQEGSNLVWEGNAQTNAAKRHSGQRSRVRKLEYIAELERTVDALQNLESELAVQVASLLQQRAALTTENGKLQRQVARLKKEKLTVDCQYQSLKKELESLKLCGAYSFNGNLYKDVRSAEGGV